MLLAYGTRLRRHVASARHAPRCDALDALGALPWADRARREPRASGDGGRRTTPPASAELTAQELEIATLAARGLTNREIGRQLFISTRTVSSHLYRIFPKLGVTSRSQLAAALGLVEGRGGHPDRP